MSRQFLFTLIATGLAAGLATPVAADSPAEDAQKYRVSVMTSLRGHIGAASMIVRGLVEDGGYLQKHADGLASSASELQRLFPAGSAVGDSEALPVIWEQPEEFARAVDEAEAATARLQKVVAEGGDRAAIAAAFKDVGGACRGCHDRFRKDDD